MSSRSASPSIAQVFFTFLGTSSAVPTLRRNVTSAVLRCDGEAMVFDVGEGTQHQLMKSQVIRQGRIKRIFITHMHGDHTFGLPGLVTGLCGVKKDMLRDDPYPVRQASEKLRIYGPRGVKEFLLSALRLTRMRIPRDFFIHELIDTPEEASAIMAREAASGVNSAAGLTLHDPSEPASNTLVLPTLDAAGNRTWNLYDGPAFQMMAGAIAHTVPCWGYVFREHDQPGALDLERLMVSPLGSKRLGPWLQALKNGETIEGVRREDVCGPTLVGRKVVVMGDTCDPAGIAHLAHKCNLLVHEVTMRDSGSSGVEKVQSHTSCSCFLLFSQQVPGFQAGPQHDVHDGRVCALGAGGGAGSDALWRGNLGQLGRRLSRNCPHGQADIRQASHFRPRLSVGAGGAQAVRGAARQRRSGGRRQLGRSRGH